MSNLPIPDSKDRKKKTGGATTLDDAESLFVWTTFWSIRHNKMMMLALLVVVTLCVSVSEASSVAREWNEALLKAIRNDLARPPVHARNLFHVSAAMWDAWAAYSTTAEQWLHKEKHSIASSKVDEARRETISYAAYRILKQRFTFSPGRDTSLLLFQDLLKSLGYDDANDSTTGNSPSALGNRIADAYLRFGFFDGSNENFDYAHLFYAPVNPALYPENRGNPNLVDPNRWQPLGIGVFVDQAGNVFSGGAPSFQSPEWGKVTPFALGPDDMTIHSRDGHEYQVFHDPGPPPLLFSEEEALYKKGFEQVVLWSGLLDPEMEESIDISPSSRGNNTLGTNDGTGYTGNPITGQPYEPQLVPAGDYYRVLAEFWADGPDSETPPGHWYTIANQVSDHPELVRAIGGEGSVLDPLEWDVKLYLALGGAMHDAAIAAWSTKGWYDYVRPISAVRYMAALGQCSDPDALSYHPDGINLYPGAIELITSETVLPGERHEHLAGYRNGFVGKIAVKAWRGPSFIDDPDIDTAGVGWILAEEWWPYQRPSFVTPPFAGYVSGHSTFSRAAARALTDFTGSPYFPGGLAEFHAPQNTFLVFERGPSVNVTLQWAKYFDAADECSLSRIYGGIHPTADDIPGRLMGEAVGAKAVEAALALYAERTLWPWRILMFSAVTAAVVVVGTLLLFRSNCSKPLT